MMAGCHVWMTERSRSRSPRSSDRRVPSAGHHATRQDERITAPTSSISSRRLVLALAIQRWHSTAGSVSDAEVGGTRPTAIVGGIMGHAFVSMWVSKPATAAMMVPIALAIIDLSLLRGPASRRAHGGIPQDDVDDLNLALSLLLGVAYPASIGGLGTIIARRPTASSCGSSSRPTAWRSRLPMDAGRIPTMLLFLPLAWLLNTRVLFPTRIRESRGRAWIRDELARLGRSRAASAARWRCSPSPCSAGVPALLGGSSSRAAPLAQLSDAHRGRRRRRAVIIPVDRAKGVYLMDWTRRSSCPGAVDPVRGGWRSRGDGGERRGAVHRQPGAGLCRLAGDGRRVHDHRLMVFMSTHVEHGRWRRCCRSWRARPCWRAAGTVAVRRRSPRAARS